MAQNENERPDELLPDTAQPEAEETPAAQAPVQDAEQEQETDAPGEEAEDAADADDPEEAPEDERPRRREPQRSGSQKKKKKKKKKKRRGGRIYGVLIMLTLIFVISISLAIGIIEVGKDMLGINGTETLVLFNIPEGATTAEIAEGLKEAGVIRIPKAFVYFTRLSKADANFMPGDHEVSSAMAYETLIAELTGAVQQDDTRVSVDVMFPEGITLNEAAKKLEEAGVCDASKFIYYFNAGGLGYRFEDYLPKSTSHLKFQKMEGYFFPDTYTFYEETDPSDVVNKIYMNFNVKITDADYARMQELGRSLDEIITLASIIQMEAANESEMADISSVFWNRLNNPEVASARLQSDPTSRYVEDTIKPNIDIADQLVYDAYDTYVCSGLPAGAICNPGRAAITAALYPNDTDYYYFYANVDTGQTYFARTLEEHNANIEMVAQERAEAAAAEAEAAQGAE